MEAKKLTLLAILMAIQAFVISAKQAKDNELTRDRVDDREDAETSDEEEGSSPLGLIVFVVVAILVAGGVGGFIFYKKRQKAKEAKKEQSGSDGSPDSKEKGSQNLHESSGHPVGQQGKPPGQIRAADAYSTNTSPGISDPAGPKGQLGPKGGFNPAMGGAGFISAKQEAGDKSDSDNQSDPGKGKEDSDYEEAGHVQIPMGHQGMHQQRINPPAAYPMNPAMGMANPVAPQGQGGLNGAFSSVLAMAGRAPLPPRLRMAVRAGNMLQQTGATDAILGSVDKAASKAAHHGHKNGHDGGN